MSDSIGSQSGGRSAETAELATLERRIVHLAASGAPKGEALERQERIVQTSMAFARALAGSDRAAFLQVFAVAFNVADTIAGVPDRDRRETALNFLNALEAGTRAMGSSTAMRLLAPEDSESIFMDPEYVENND